MGPFTHQVHGRFNMTVHIYGPSAVRDEDTGQMLRTWDYVEGNDINYDAGEEVVCIARGIMGGGIRVVGSTERWEEDYLPIDWAKIQVPPDTVVTKRHRLGNIKDGVGNVNWKTNQGNPAIFNVVGVTPVIDPFGQPIELDILVKKAPHIQRGEEEEPES
jgi:hypothetical protein